MDTYRGTAVVIPTRNRAELAAVAIRSVLAQAGGALAGVLVSDNSNDSEESGRLAAFCEAAGDARLHYVRPPESLPMSPHWHWAAGRALELADASHVTFLTDRMVFRDGALSKLARVASLHPKRVVSYMHDKVADDGVPVRVHLNPWSGKLYRIESESLLRAVSRSRLYEPLPRMLNCHVPRAVLLALCGRHGSFFGSIAPDFSFCFRALAAERDILFLDESLIFHHALNRSNGASFVRGEVTRDSADFMAGLRGGGDYFAAPVPGILTVHNAIIHEYCVARDETGSAKFAPVDEEKYLGTIASELGDIVNPPARRAVEEQLAARGWQPAPAAPHTPLWRKLLSPSRVWGRVSRAVGKAGGAAAEGGRDECPSFPTVEAAVDYARTARGAEVEASPWAEPLDMEELPMPALRAGEATPPAGGGAAAAGGAS
jgi:hypothetical protein